MKYLFIVLTEKNGGYENTSRYMMPYEEYTHPIHLDLMLNSIAAQERGGKLEGRWWSTGEVSTMIDRYESMPEDDITVAAKYLVTAIPNGAHLIPHLEKTGKRYDEFDADEDMTKEQVQDLFDHFEFGDECHIEMDDFVNDLGAGYLLKFYYDNGVVAMANSRMAEFYDALWAGFYKLLNLEYDWPISGDVDDLIDENWEPKLSGETHRISPELMKLIDYEEDEVLGVFHIPVWAADALVKADMSKLTEGQERQVRYWLNAYTCSWGRASFFATGDDILEHSDEQAFGEPCQCEVLEVRGKKLS